MKRTVKVCTLIQWGQGKTALSEKGPICPECGEPAEMILGMMGPCWAHKRNLDGVKPKRRRK